MVVGAGDDPSIGEYERLLMSVKTTARKELILLHPERSVAAGSTREWLKVCLAHIKDESFLILLQIRPWISRHFHVELPVRHLLLSYVIASYKLGFLGHYFP